VLQPYLTFNISNHQFRLIRAMPETRKDASDRVLRSTTRYINSITDRVSVFLEEYPLPAQSSQDWRKELQQKASAWLDELKESNGTEKIASIEEKLSQLERMDRGEERMPMVVDERSDLSLRAILSMLLVTFLSSQGAPIIDP
jgi:hypothetical protein